MRIKLLCAVALGVVAGASAAAAQTTNGPQTITIESSVAPFCANFGTPPAPLNLGELAGPNGFLVSAFAGDTDREIAAGYYCNAPSTVTLKADPLVHTTVTTVADSSSFTNRVDFLASLVWNAYSGSVSSTVVDGVEIDAIEANIGAVVLTVSDPVTAGNLRPIAGAYEGAVHVTIALQN